LSLLSAFFQKEIEIQEKTTSPRDCLLLFNKYAFYK
jgi:hypothetical protein